MTPAGGANRDAPKDGVLRAAGAMGIATFFSRIGGLAREQVFAFYFGAGHATDAFNIAFRIPNLLRDLFAEGAMSAALVPTFTRVRIEEGERRAWRLAGLVFRTLFVAVSLLAVVGVVFAPQLVSLYASSFKGVEGKFELTVSMTRIMFPFFPLVALAAAFMAILNASGKFFLPAFSSALFNLTSIGVGVLCIWILPRYGYAPIEGMAVGVLMGGAVQAACQWPVLRGVGYRWQPRASGEPAWHRDPALRRMLLLMIPGTLGLAATQINILVNSILATSQEAGAVSWLNYAFRLLQFPIGIFGVSLAAATLPRVSQLWVEKDFAGVSATLTQSLKRVFAINFPAAAGLAFLGGPIVQLLFEYGRFQPSDTLATAWGLAAYSAGLVAYSAVKVLVPACYAMGDTRVPVVSSVLSVALTIGLNLLLIGPLGYVGLAVGTSVAALFNATFLLFSIRRLIRDKGGVFSFRSVLGSAMGHFFIALVMGAACFLLYREAFQALPGSVGPLETWLGPLGKVLIRAGKVGLCVGFGVVLTVGLAKIMGLGETTEALDLFTKKIKKKLSR